MGSFGIFDPLRWNNTYVRNEPTSRVLRNGAKEEVQAGRNAAVGNAAAAIVPHCSDARELPFDDGVFDAVR